MSSAATLASDASSFADRRQQILAGFAGDIPPVKVPWLYHLGLLVVAVAMVALPLIYVGLVALAGYGVYYHAIHSGSILQTVRID